MLKMQSEILRDIVPVMTYKKVFFMYIYIEAYFYQAGFWRPYLFILFFLQFYLLKNKYFCEILKQIIKYMNKNKNILKAFINRNLKFVSCIF